MQSFLKSSAFLVFFALVQQSCMAAEDSHLPSDLERAYVGLALDTERYDICSKISPQSREGYLLNSPGTQVYYTRSACYQYLARRTLNPFFCRQVREAQSGWFQSGDHFSKKNCEKLVKSGKTFRAHLGFDHEIVLRAAGYTDEDVRETIVDHPRPGSWMEFYHGFQRRNDGSLLQKLNDLPDFSR